MPTLQIEHLSEHFQAFQDLTNSDSPVLGNIGCTGYTGSDQAQPVTPGALVTPGDPSLGTLFQIDPLGLGPIPPDPTLGIWLGKFGVQAWATDLEALPFGPNPHWAILPWGTLCSIAPFGLGQNARWTDLPLANTSWPGQLQKVSLAVIGLPTSTL